MNQWRVLYTFLLVFIVAASCRRVFDIRQSGIAINTLAQHLQTNISPLSGDNEKDKDNGEYLYTVPNGKKTCTSAKMEIAVKVPRKKQDGNDKADFVSLEVPSKAKVTGNCSPVLSEMTLTWKPPETVKDGNPSNEVDETNSIRFTFLNDHTSFSLFSVDINIYLDKKNFPDKTGNRYKATSGSDLRLFSAPLVTGIHVCDGRDIKVGEATVTIKNVRLFAFNNDDKTESRKEEKCKEKEDGKKTFNYSVKDETGKECLLAKMSISLNVQYKAKDHSANAIIPVPSELDVNGDCSSDISTMKLTWKPKGVSTFDETESNNEIDFQFRRVNEKTYLYGAQVSLILDEKDFPDSVEETKAGYAQTNVFSASSQNGMYSCAKETRINAKGIELIIKDVLLVAFDVQGDFNKKAVTDCDAYSFDDHFKYVVRKDNKEIPCIVADMAIDISVPYDTKENEKKIGNPKIEYPLKVTGSCGPKTSTMTITWTAPNTKFTNNITFNVFRNPSIFYVYQVEANIYLDEKNFKEAANQNKLVSGITEPGLYKLFAADRENGYYKSNTCSEEVKVDDITLNIKDVSFIAFNTANDVSSKKETVCSKNDNTSPGPDTEPTTQKTSETAGTTSTVPPESDSAGTSPPTSETTEAPTEPPSDDETPSYAGAIAGGVIGGIAALALIIFLIIMCKRRSDVINRTLR